MTHPYQPYQQPGRPQSMALAAMLAGRGMHPNPMDPRRQLARRYAGLMALMMGGRIR